MNPSFAPSHRSAADLPDPLPRAIDDLVRRLFQRHRPAFAGRTAELRAALETAEAVAWCTPFPHLFLPALAEQQIALLAEAPAAAGWSVAQAA